MKRWASQIARQRALVRFYQERAARVPDVREKKHSERLAEDLRKVADEMAQEFTQYFPDRDLDHVIREVQGGDEPPRIRTSLKPPFV